MEKITSFTIDHIKLKPGIYVSRIDGDVTTYDLRTRRPNVDLLMDNSTIHSVEHMFATYIRNGALKEQVLYFGPMGCQTGFYLLVRDADHDLVIKEVRAVLQQIIDHDGEVFGKSPIECGHYQTLSIEAAKVESQKYLAILADLSAEDLRYPV
nr:S-ribosylhomocysteine lyase [Bacilli bacterium]